MCVPAFAQEIVVDEPAATMTGRWQTIKEASTFASGDTFQYAMSVEGREATATATFRPNIPATGRYHVEIFSSPGRNRSSNVPIIVSGAEGPVSLVMDQTAKPAGWHRVAENVLFNAGTGGYAEIHNNAGGGEGKIVMADAVRFVPAEGSVKSGFELLTTVDTGGKVQRSPNQKTFAPGDVVTLTAEPEDGYVFNGWTGDTESMVNPLTVTIDKNTRINAQFVPGGSGAILDASDAVFEGSWLTNAGKWGARTNYQFASTCIRDGVPAKLSTATYQPDLAKSGLYDIYIWYSKGTNRATDASWEIVGKNTPVTVKVNQQINGGDWFQIGAGVEFERGRKGYVRLSNISSQVNYVVVADSVAFVYMGKP